MERVCCFLILTMCCPRWVLEKGGWCRFTIPMAGFSQQWVTPLFVGKKVFFMGLKAICWPFFIISSSSHAIYYHLAFSFSDTVVHTTWHIGVVPLQLSANLSPGTHTSLYKILRFVGCGEAGDRLGLFFFAFSFSCHSQTTRTIYKCVFQEPNRKAMTLAGA